MQYYTLELFTASPWLCITSSTFLLYKYKYLPMGVKQLSGIGQEIIENLFWNLDEVKVYFDDIRNSSSIFSIHAYSLDVTLTYLVKMILLSFLQNVHE